MRIDVPDGLLYAGDPLDRKMVWVRPELIAEVKFTGWAGAVASAMPSISACEKTRRHGPSCGTLPILMRCGSPSTGEGERQAPLAKYGTSRFRRGGSHLDPTSSIVTAADAQATQDEANASGAWLMWFVTVTDPDYPGKFVAWARRADPHGGTRMAGNAGGGYSGRAARHAPTAEARS